MEVKIFSQASFSDFYNNGVAFLKAMRRCFSDENGKMIKNGQIIQLPVPTVVNAAFSCEMFLKAILIFEGTDYPTDRKGHHLLQLYSLISDKNKKRISAFCMPGNDSEGRFSWFLCGHASDFTDIRYFMEREGWQGMSPLEMMMLAENLFRITHNILFCGNDE